MSRYVLPLVLTVVLYLGIISTLLFSLNTTTEISKQKKNDERVTFTIISQPPVVKPKVQTLTKVEKKVQKKQEPKKVLVKKTVKKVIKPKKTPPKKIVKKVTKPKKIEKVFVEKKIIKKEELAQVKEEKPTEIQKEEIVRVVEEVVTVPKISEEEQRIALQNRLNVEAEKKRLLEEKKSLYFLKIKENISQNKVYPRIARKRRIQDSVKVKFIISKDGDFIGFESIQAKSIFKKSVEKAIVSTFPLKPQSGLFYENINISLTINYRLL